MNLFDMKKRREDLLSKSDGIIKVAETSKRNMTEQETKDVQECINEVDALAPQIAIIEKANTLRLQFPTGRVLTDVPKNNQAKASAGKRLSAEYMEDFQVWAASKGRVVGEHMGAGADGDGGFVFPTERRISAAQYEGSNAAGGFAVPSQVQGEIIPLAPPEFGVHSIATVIPTSMDLKFPRKTAHGTAAFKSESGGATNNFGGADPTIDQFTLSAFMLGHIEDASWELLQDVSAFQAFMTDDILLSLAVSKEDKFVNGSGSGEPQGLIGNTGTGTGVRVEPDSNSNNVSIVSTLDVMGTLNAVYHPNASWLMTRKTSIVIRKAQVQSNLFEPVWTRVGNQDYLHSYPVTFSASMPEATRGLVPVLFGDFKRGYLIGERGGSGVNVKILDQTKAVSGLLEILGYQRFDGRVRRSEAIQQIQIALS